jgi:hypothetical protein
MTLPSSGSISASQIRTEFGASGSNNSVSLGNYRKSVSVGVYSNLPLDDGIPQGTAAIGLGNFRGKSLNVVLDLGTDTEYRVNLKTKYDNSTPTMVGGYATKPTNTSGKKILISIDNKSIGSDKAATNNVALRTGSWDSGTMLFVRIGTSGEIIGAGGDGGGGGGANNGGNGTSAFGIDYPVTIENYGLISCGFGGGGGGNNAYYDNTPPPEEPPPPSD